MSGFDYRQIRPIFLNLSATRPEDADLSRFVQSFSTNKNQSMSPGGWQVNLIPQPNQSEPTTENFPTGMGLDNFESYLMGIVKQMDVVIVGFWGADPTTGQYTDNHIMFGYVDRVFKTRRAVNNQVSRGITIRGRDGTKPFVVDNVENAPELKLNADLVEAFSDQAQRLEFLGLARGLDSEGHNVFIDSYLPKALYWILVNIPFMLSYVAYQGGAKKVWELFATHLFARKEDRLFDANLNQYAGSVASYMAQIYDEMFYEMWVDTLPKNSPANPDRTTKPILYLRPKPYDRPSFEVDSTGKPLDFTGVTLHPDPGSRLVGDGVIFTNAPSGKPIQVKSWEDLTGPYNIPLTISKEDILDRNFGRSDEEVFTMFRCIGDKDVLAASEVSRFGFYFPMIDAAMTKIYGLRALTGTSRLLPYVYDASISDDLGQSDLDQWPDPWIPYKPSFEPTGISSYEDALTAIGNNDKKKLNTADLVTILTKAKRDRLWRWNRYNHLLYSGTMQIKGQQVFVGTKVLLPDEDYVIFDRANNKLVRYPGGMAGYCVGVQQSYAFGQGLTTTLSIVRAVNEAHLKEYHDNRNFGQPIGKANQMFEGTGATI